MCDPACGSGTFPVAALRFLTDALYASLHHHARLTETGDRTIVRLLGVESAVAAGAGAESIDQELLPCRPDEALFEPRLKAVLRRHIVERCIYGVDLDPLAVELCRLALWIETMDRTLPFSFLDHKVKCGNSLVGAWFDQFQHYPVMAWKNREGGDKGHTNGVHFEKDARTRAIKAFVKDRLTPDIRRFLSGPTLFSDDLQEQAGTVHDEALAALARVHALPVQDSAERARIYRDEVVGSPAYQSLKLAMDLWCACWFWPADQLQQAPLPTTLASPPEDTRAIAARIATAKRFFHWELEFPDVFRGCSPPRSSFLVPHSYSGFDAVLGNPPWDTLQPNSQEFFSNIDPLYRSYGKQDALRSQTNYFTDESTEQSWLAYCSGFASDSNWMKFAAFPFGDPVEAARSDDKFPIARGRENDLLHDRWRSARAQARSLVDPVHPFRYRGEGKAYTYKLFLEQAHALLWFAGRLGFVVPSGLYSDHGTGGLRQLFLDRCQWEWLFGFENREKIFDIHSRFKFNPVIIQKGGSTSAIRTAFMRRKLEDWERAESFATPYSRQQIERFSPRSKAILEIQSGRDLEILEKIYGNSVLLGDEGPDGWGIKYAQGDFNMTSDSKLFPPRPWWEAQGYRPDEYSRWLKGDWRSIAELWTELGIDPARVVPVDVELEEWLFDTSAGPEERTAGARRVHDHLLKPGDVQRTAWRFRCAQPPYDRLPIPRADIPAGIILSRDADAWIREKRVEGLALPLFQGVMIWIGRPYAGVCVSVGRGQKDWAPSRPSSTEVTPKYLIAAGAVGAVPKLVFRDISNATNVRTVVSALLPGFPCGNVLGTLSSSIALEGLAAITGSLVADWQVRQRIAGTHLNWFVIEELAVLPPRRTDRELEAMSRSSNAVGAQAAAWAVERQRRGAVPSEAWRGQWALAPHELTRSQLTAEATIASRYGLDVDDLRCVLGDCDYSEAAGDPKGFWRVDKDKDPELRHTVLTLVAFHDLDQKIQECRGDRDKGIELFLSQNDGEGWMLPETLRLADYGLGHDDRAKERQPVASRLGPRFFDWQLTQSAEESWRECHLHARNLLGDAEYQHLLGEIAAGTMTGPASPAEPRAPSSRGKSSLPFD